MSIESEGRIDPNVITLKSKIGEYERAVETYYKAFDLCTYQNNLEGKIISVEEIDWIMEMNQKIINTREDLVNACWNLICES